MLHFIPWCFTFMCLFCKNDIINEGKWFPFKYIFLKNIHHLQFAPWHLLKYLAILVWLLNANTLYMHTNTLYIHLFSTKSTRTQTGLAPYLVCKKHHTRTHTHTQIPTHTQLEFHVACAQLKAPQTHKETWLVWPALHKDTHHAHKVMAGLTCFAQRHSPCTQSHGWFDLLCTKTLTMHTLSHSWFDLLCTKTLATHTVIAGLTCFTQRHHAQSHGWFNLLCTKTLATYTVMAGLTCFAQRHHARSHGWFDLLCTKTLTMHTKSWLVWLALHKDTMHKVLAGLTCFAQRHSPCTQSHGWFDLLHTKTPCTQLRLVWSALHKKHSLYTQVAWHWVLHKKTFSGMKPNLVYLAFTCTNTVHTQIWPAHLRIAQIWQASSDPHTVQIWPASPGMHSQSHSPNRSGQLYLACTQHKQMWPIWSANPNRSGQFYLACTQHKQIWPIWSGLHTAQI